ncbi:sensor histidine kinase [Alkalicoccus urumqiensis]|uniref:Sensor histidine kinase n=1 Tax=Alkalicoccus urumqiensis TaxID=1548213 RepID=A0A2P6MF31_ALKUR|nr:sensor histidine kinase [Alkalicoccus urumqiensis]PRO64909.1 sensor histidine kinase [Alkalicoccus urumqiensis]
MSWMRRWLLLSGSLLTGAVLLLTAAAVFSFEQATFSLLWSTSIFGMPFFLFSLLVILVTLSLLGISATRLWQKREQAVEARLDAALEGAAAQSETDPLHQKIALLQERMDRLTQRARQLASEKAEEREKSLQEVVIQERTRLARELHDSVSQQLFAASMMIAAVNESRPGPELAEKLHMIEKMINQSQLEMRALLLHLRPAALKNKTLRQGVEELLQDLSQKVPLHITSSIEEVAVDKGAEDHLFRIIQEAVSNCLRHAEAQELEVLLGVRDQKAVLQITDNGRGFTVGEDTFGSYGIHTMKERAEEVGGRMKVISVPGEGTRIDVQIPVLEGGDQ